MTDNVARGRHTTLQKVAFAFGLVFLLVGVLGFIPGITENLSHLQVFGHDHQHPAQLLGIFDVSVFHNLVHLLFGIAGVLLSRTFDGAKQYLVVGGVVYLLLFVVGLLIDNSDSVNFVPVNGADNWLHLFLGLVMLGAGVALGKRRGGLVNGVGGRDYDNDIL